uniref:Uncharacterized protein n=1 Tax=Alexandrium monilatum TaxID=311494 RepID=A0A6T0XAU3_9DINO
MSEHFLQQSAQQDVNDLSPVVQPGGHWCICAWAWASAVERDPKGAEGLQLDCNATNGRLREVYKQFTSLPGRVYASRAALARVDALCGPGAPSPLPAFAASLLACRLPGGPSPAVFGAILAGSAVASAALSAWPWLARRLHSGGSGSQRLLAA